MLVQELFNPMPVAANSTTVLAVTGAAAAIGGFICTTAGNIKVTDGADTDIVAQVGVTAGQFLPLPIACGNGCKVVLSGGCVGTILLARR